MRNEKIISELDSFLKLVENYEESIYRLNEVNGKIESLNISKDTPLNEFDNEYLPKYIKNKIGNRPKEFAKLDPRKLLKPFSEKKSNELEKFAEKEKEVTKQYYEEFAEQRNEIQREALADFEQKISVLNSKKNEVQSIIDNLENQINSSNLLPQRFKKSKYIKKIIKYLADWRADNVKEAISILCFDEELKYYVQQIDSKLMKLEEDIYNIDRSMKEEIRVKFANLESSISDLNDRLYDLKSD